MISHVLSVDGFYFSTTYDLTHTLQRLANTSPEFQEMSLLERVRMLVPSFLMVLEKTNVHFHGIYGDVKIDSPPMKCNVL